MQGGEYWFTHGGWDGWYILTPDSEPPRSRPYAEFVDPYEAQGIVYDALRGRPNPWGSVSGPTLPNITLGGFLPCALWRVGHWYSATNTMLEPLIPIEPLPDPAEDSQDLPTWFELRLVDEVGQPLPCVPVQLLVDGSTMAVATDPDGRARANSPAGSSSASGRVAEPQSAFDALSIRWAVIRDEPLLEPSGNDTFLRCADLSSPQAPRTQLKKEIPHTLVVYPDVVLAQFVGMYFETDRSFVLSNPHLAEVKPLFEEHPQANLLVVGHTDTVGDCDYNDALSLERAKSVAAYLQDDVDAWLACYTDALPSSRRWGGIEDTHMLTAILSEDAAAPTHDRIRYFQQSRGLAVDGVCGPQTRRKLIEEYMKLDDTRVPSTMSVEVCGCGEHFPLDATGEELDQAPTDDADDPHDRRVELFLFNDGLGVLPPVPGPNLLANAPEYLEWRRRARQKHEFSQQLFVLRVRLHDCFGTSMPGVEYLIEHGPSRLSGNADAEGFLSVLLPLSTATCRVTWDPREGSTPDQPLFGYALETFGWVGDLESEEGLRRRLHNLGHPIDGDLRRNLLDFQQQRGLPVTGSFDDPTRDKLREVYDEALDEAFELDASPPSTTEAEQRT